MKPLSIFKIFSDIKKDEVVEDDLYNANLLKKKANLSETNLNYKGLSSKVAEKILKKNGENSIKSQKNISAVKIFAGQFKDFLVLILLIATVVSIFMGELIEAVCICTILFLNAVMGFIQEYKTEKTLEALDDMITPTANVFRDNFLKTISVDEIVVGDLILIKSGETVAADALILKCDKLEVDESILTGESVPVLKEVDPSLDEKNDLNKKNLVYMGTAVVRGKCIAKVVATGKETQMGKIADMLENINGEETPLQKKLDQMGKFIIFACVFVSFFVILFGVLRGENVFDMIITGLSLAVASVPEGLPAIVTIALAFAVKHMIKKKALVRKLHAVETLGCANVICTDKTGTITQNKMTVKKIVTANFDFDVKGDGLKKTGYISLENEAISKQDYIFLEELLITSVVCNSSKIFVENKQDDCWQFVGEPTEVALLVAAHKFGIDRKKLEYEIFEEIPFDSSKKFMTVFAKFKNNKKFVFVKGAYEVVLKKCKFYKEKEIVSLSSVRKIFDEKIKLLSKQGMRVLAFAYKEINGIDLDEENLTFLGLVAMLDPPRKEAAFAVKLCKNAGIKTVMITGDDGLTAKAIAKQVGIYKEGDCCLQGKDLDDISDFELKQKIKKTTVFARVSPNHKLRIVKAFKKTGNVVAMTGDGVNDAPAIKEANIGVSMGVSGSEVTKQAADLVLLDDNFSTLVSAVEEGRIIYKNIRKFMRYLLSCNIGEVLTSFFAIILGLPIPLFPMQILLINLVTDSLPAIALGLEPKEEEIMNSAPRNARESIFSKGLLLTIVVRGFLIAITTLMVFIIIFKLTLSLEISRTATFLTLVSLQLIHVFECKSETKSIFQINHLNNKKLLVAIAISFFIAISSIWVSPFNRLIKNYPLTFKQTIIVIFFTMFVPLVNAIFLMVKSVFNKRRVKKEAILNIS